MLYPPDFERAYQLLPAYIKSPDLALSVQEFIPGVGFSEQWLGDDPLGPSPPISDGDHASVKDHVAKLGMGTDITRIMLDSLDWWKQRWKVHAAHAWTPDDAVSYLTPENKAQNQAYAFSETITTLVLSLCKSISTVYFSREALTATGPLREYLRASNYGLTPYPALQGLRHVRYHSIGPVMNDWCYETVEFLNLMRCVHRLPLIASISLDGVSDHETEPQEFFPPSTSTGLKQIHLSHVDIQPGLLSTIVRIPAGLEELSLSFGGLFYPDGSPTIDPALLGKALRQHKSTLRALSLYLGHAEIWVASEDYGNDCDEMEIPDGDDERYYDMDLAASKGAALRASELERDHESETIGSLRDYSALTRLSISVKVLVAVVDPNLSMPNEAPEFRLIDILPANLEYLCLFGYEKGKNLEMDGLVQEVVDSRSERLPRLREIVGVDEPEPGVWLRPEGSGVNDDTSIEDLKEQWQGPRHRSDAEFDWLEV